MIMAFPKDTIRLGTAKAIFTGVDFEEVSIGDKVVGYKAKLDGFVYEHASLTALCRALWSCQRAKTSLLLKRSEVGS